MSGFIETWMTTAVVDACTDTIVFQDKSDDCYIDKEHRRCIAGISATCVNTLPEGYGHISSFDRRKGGGYKPSCRACCQEYKKQYHLQAAQNDIATLVSRATRRPLVGHYGPPIGEYAQAMFARLGGASKVAEMSAEACELILTGGSRPKDKLDTIRVLHDLLHKSQEPAAPPIDMSQLDEEELADLLKKYAADLLRTDAEFRKSLLNDPEIRGQLLEEVGVTVLEAEAESEFEE